jgi:DHA3 family tetracycline resistance protein-like MFS transporter
MTAAGVFLFRAALGSFATGMIFIGLSAYYIRDVGMTPLQLVLVGTAIELTCFLFEVPTGVVADTWSRKGSVLIGGFMIGACYVITGLAPLFIAIIIAEIIRGIGETFVSGAEEAWITDEVGADNVGGLFMRAGQVAPIFNLIGVWASVLLASLFGYGLPILLGALLLIGQAAICIFIMPETAFKPTPRGEQSVGQSMFGTFKAGAIAIRTTPVLLLLVMMELFIGASSEGFDRLAEAQYLTTLQLPPMQLPWGTLDPIAWFGVFITVSAFLNVTLLEVARRRVSFTDHAKVAKAMFAFNAIIIAATLGFALAGHFLVAFGLELIRGTAYSLMRPIAATWMNQNIDSRIRATVLSMNGQANALGQIAGGPGIGWVGNAYGIRAAIALAGILLTPSLALIYRTIKRDSLTSDASITPAIEPASPVS